MSASSVRYVVQVGALTAVYFAAAKVGLLLATVGAQVTLVWPPTGIALAALLLGGPRLWPGVVLGATLVNASTGVPLATACDDVAPPPGRASFTRAAAAAAGAGAAHGPRPSGQEGSHRRRRHAQHLRPHQRPGAPRHGGDLRRDRSGGIDLLASRPDIDVVLMDIMLPELDGYGTMRRIRVLPGHAAQPLIALTAKAMSGDREKCLEAGASDDISKPVHVGQLFALLRVWRDRAAPR
jgi:CheY-like chemotaxis protein